MTNLEQTIEMEILEIKDMLSVDEKGFFLIDGISLTNRLIQKFFARGIQLAFNGRIFCSYKQLQYLHESHDKYQKANKIEDDFISKFLKK